MSLRDLARLLARRWYTLLLAVIVAAAGTAFLVRDGGLYTSRTLVTFTQPGSTPIMRYNGSDSWGVITFATTIATLVNGQQTHSQYYSRLDAPLYGAGLREASSVSVQDQGSQWVSDVTSAVIEVQIVGRTSEWVEQRQSQLLDEIVGLSASTQVQQGIAGDDRIVATVEPLTREVAFVGPTARAKALAAGALLAASMVAGTAFAWLLERWDPRVRTRRLPLPALERTNQEGATV